MLYRYILLAETLARESDRVAAEASIFFRDSGYQVKSRDRVMTALACKADGAFRALTEDPRAQSGEAMHHLKTMVEVFIYFYVVAADDSTDRTANGLIAKCVADEHAKRLRVIEPGSADLKEWEMFGDELRHEAVTLGNLADLAGPLSGPLGGWYANVYRFACQSAHLGDLLEWMPDEGGRLVIAKSAPASLGRLRALSAIYYAVVMVLSLFETIAADNVAGLQIDTGPFRAELAAIRKEEVTHNGPTR